MATGWAPSYFVNCFNAFHASKLHGLFDIPNERTNTYFFVPVVELLDGLEQIVYLLVFNHGDDGRIHFRPGVSAPTRFSVPGTAALYVFKEGKSADAQLIKQVFDPFGVGLIEYNKYSFHNLLRIILVGLRFLLHQQPIA